MPGTDEDMRKNIMQLTQMRALAEMQVQSNSDNCYSGGIQLSAQTAIHFFQEAVSATPILSSAEVACGTIAKMFAGNKLQIFPHDKASLNQETESYSQSSIDRSNILNNQKN